MNEKEIISGVVADLKVIPTRTGKSMVMFTVDRRNVKAFGDNAAALQSLNGEQVTLEVKRGSYMGKEEYAVISVAGRSASTNATPNDVASNAPTYRNPLSLKHRERETGRDYRNGVQATVARFIDELTPEEWAEWKRLRSYWFPISQDGLVPIGGNAGNPIYSEEQLKSVRERLQARLDDVRLILRERNAKRESPAAVKQETPAEKPAEAQTATAPETELEPYLTAEEAEALSVLVQDEETSGVERTGLYTGGIEIG
jgi:hypothetical protein